jgi:amino acid transporter
MAAPTLDRDELAHPTTPPSPGPLAPSAPHLPPDSLRYRLKSRLLGPPLHSDQLEDERLGNPTALAVFASDNLSSSAYATEEILRVLVPYVGLAAFALVVPITTAMLVVLAFLILSYRETIKAYPSAGGAYVVTRDNFGSTPAQVAGVALLTDYILTVAVSVSAGTAALTSAVPALRDFSVPIAVGFIVLIAFGNLRGVRESGKLFAIPTYFFIVNMVLLLSVGLYKFAMGQLHPLTHFSEHAMPLGSHAGDGFLLGASLYVVLHAFASGGAAVTGVEAISNGVPAFRQPAWKNARKTLVVMGSLLGVMFLGLSMLAARLHVVPAVEGVPTVIAQIGRLVFGDSVVGHVLFYALQAGTMLILVLAANTSFADFPRLASFQAGDSFMPRQLTKRGHRLVFSNGVIFLSAAAILLVIVTQAKVERLIPLYAIGVFTSFTLSQAGMARHHLREREPHWRKGLVVNGVGAVLSLIVDLIIAYTKFSHGAWVIIVLVPILVFFLVRLEREYTAEARELELEVPEAVEARVMRRHVVLVFVDQLDLAVARAIQYARSLTPDELRAVHFAIEDAKAEVLRGAWTRLGLTKVPLEIVECPDRRLTRCAVETVARDLADGETEVTVLLPDRKYRGIWHRILHDRTSEAIERDLSVLPHANVTTVPFHFAKRNARKQLSEDTFRRAMRMPARRADGSHDGSHAHAAAAGTTVVTLRRHDGAGPVPIAMVRAREEVTVVGRARSIRVQPLRDAPSLEIVLVDDTGAMSVVFLGRSKLAGIRPGTRLRVHGTASVFRGRLAILNPVYDILR